MQCVVKDDPDTGKRVVAGTHWDFDSYGGTIKKKMGVPTQVCAAPHALNQLMVSSLQFWKSACKLLFYKPDLLF